MTNLRLTKNKAGRGCQAWHMQSAGFSEEENMTQEVGVDAHVTALICICIQVSQFSMERGKGHLVFARHCSSLL